MASVGLSFLQQIASSLLCFRHTQNCKILNFKYDQTLFIAYSYKSVKATRLMCLI